MLNRVDGDEERVCLARAPESISAAELIDVAFQLVDDDSRGRPSGLIDRLREAQRNLASQQTLAGLRAAGG